MADINTCTFTGRLVADPDVRQTRDGKTVARFRVAVAGYRRDDVSFLDFEAWGKTADTLGNYRHKGDAVGVVAHAVVDQWEKDGAKHSRVKFVVDSLPLNAGSCKHQQQSQQADVSGGQSFGSFGDEFGPADF